MTHRLLDAQGRPEGTFAGRDEGDEKGCCVNGRLGGSVDEDATGSDEEAKGGEASGGSSGRKRGCGCDGSRP